MATRVGPVRVLIIDHKSVRMTHPLTGIDSAVRVGMSDGQVKVLMLDHVRVLRRPDVQSNQRGQSASTTQNHKAHRHAET